MKTRNYQIFRADAVRRYVQRQQKGVCPTFLQPRLLVYLWILLVLSLLAAVVVIRLLPAGLLIADVPTRRMLTKEEPSAWPALVNFQHEEECR